MKFYSDDIASSDPPFYVELTSASASSTLSVRPAGLQPNNVGWTRNPYLHVMRVELTLLLPELRIVTVSKIR